MPSLKTVTLGEDAFHQCSHAVFESGFLSGG